MLGSYHRFSSVDNQSFKHFSSASSLVSGVVQATCILKFSKVFPLRLMLRLWETPVSPQNLSQDDLQHT